MESFEISYSGKTIARIQISEKKSRALYSRMFRAKTEKNERGFQRLFLTSVTAAIPESRLPSAMRPMGVSSGTSGACGGPLITKAKESSPSVRPVTFHSAGGGPYQSIMYNVGDLWWDLCWVH